MEKIVKFSFAHSATSQISSREAVRVFFSFIPKESNLSIDFRNVEFISRAAAHELLLQCESLQKKGVFISFRNLNDSLNKMIDIVSSSRKKGEKKATFVNWLEFDNEWQLDKYLETI